VHTPACWSIKNRRPGHKRAAQVQYRGLDCAAPTQPQTQMLNKWPPLDRYLADYLQIYLPDKHFISDRDMKIQLTLADNLWEFIQSSS
jgi:hypothetical protein